MSHCPLGITPNISVTLCCHTRQLHSLSSTHITISNTTQSERPLLHTHSHPPTSSHKSIHTHTHTHTETMSITPPLIAATFLIQHQTSPSNTHTITHTHTLSPSTTQTQYSTISSTYTHSIITTDSNCTQCTHVNHSSLSHTDELFNHMQMSHCNCHCHSLLQHPTTHKLLSRQSVSFSSVYRTWSDTRHSIAFQYNTGRRRSLHLLH